jgi:hypothetical protein
MFITELIVETNQTVTLLPNSSTLQGRIQDFKLGGAHLKKLRQRREVRKNMTVYYNCQMYIKRFPSCEMGLKRCKIQSSLLYVDIEDKIKQTLWNVPFIFY